MRDVALVRGLCSAATQIRTALHEWMQDELKDLRYKA